MLQKTADELKWNINISNERKYWYENIINIFVKIPKICPNCSKHNVNEKDNNTLNNPILFKCSKCGKVIYLRNNSFFGLFPRTPASLIDYIIKRWLLEENNATKIYNKIVNNTTIHISDDQTIRNILLKLRHIIAHFLRDKYEIEDFTKENNNQKIAIDESCFTHIENKQVWVIGLINTVSKEFRLIPTFKRDSIALKEIIHKYVKRGNYIISDGWQGYSWISEPNSGYYHITHVHGHGQFGYGDESTSHIEQLWSVLKELFRRIYVTIPCLYFTLFLKEIEWRYLISNKTDEAKINELVALFDYVSSTTNFNLYDLDSFNLS